MKINKEFKNENGIYKIDDELYFSLDRVSNSFLKQYTKSPIYAYSYFKASKSMEFGRLFHLYCLEPDRFNKIVICEKINGKTNEGKARKQEIIKQGLINMREDDYIKLKPMYENINYDFSKNINEITLLFDRNGVECKSKIDSYDEVNNEIIDIKTCQSLEHFEKNFYNFGYHRQAEFYTNGLSSLTDISSLSLDFKFIAIETKKPYASRIYRISPEYFYFAMHENSKWLREYKNNKENDKKLIWNKEKVLEKPKWVI